MMEWIPVVLVTFKILVLGIGMFFAIKWHYDQGKKTRANARPTVLRAAATITAIFALSLSGLLLFTFFLSRTLGLDLTFP